MRTGWMLAAVVALGPGLTSGCTPAVSQTAPVAAKPAAPRLEPATLEAQELAEFLDVSVWTFRYSGGRARCWVEIEENGKTTLHPGGGEGVHDPNLANPKADEGKILLWLKPGTLSLRLHSGASHGGYGEGLSPDALWWGWKARTANVEPFQAVTPEPGREVTLLRYKVTESVPGPVPAKAPRTITLTLKAVIGKAP